jgi:hypothetical protein
MGERGIPDSRAAIHSTFSSSSYDADFVFGVRLLRYEWRYVSGRYSDLAKFFWMPLDTGYGLFAFLFGICFCAFAIPTNQIHQWAHMPQPPRWVRRLQRYRLVLSNEEHALHHTLPYDGHYCITTGFCNRWLERIRFFRSLEWIITWFTGIPPRREEQRQRNERRGHETIR